MKKRPATPEEEEKALADNIKLWNFSNPSFEHPESFWRSKLDEAKKEGYISEVCDCGNTFLAFHHFVTCRAEGCPFSDGISLLERLVEG